MKRDSLASRDQTARLQAQLAEAQSRNALMPWVIGLLALALAAAVLLALRMRRQAQLAHSAWFHDSRMATQTPPEPAPSVESVELPLEPAAPAPAPARESPAFADPLAAAHDEPHDGGGVVDMSATMPIDRAALATLLGQGEAATPRELSVEELLDLEQQADFFIALGQEDAAVDLLMSHLRSAGGQSPLPYTKLLEIYRRQGDRSAYERTRARFNRRFNAYAPDWDTGPTAGRSLEDYPETIAHIQAMWNSPIDAMAILEAMLFKRDDTSELFDLPAYRDVLLLYSLARDLWQLGGGLTGTQVDVLLPLEDPDAPGYAPPPLPPLGGLDLPMEGSEPLSFEMTGFEAPGSRHEIDLEVPLAGEVVLGEQVHATLDTIDLGPAEPGPGPAGAGEHGAERPRKKR
jgi:pilus assembly protein FimV